MSKEFTTQATFTKGARVVSDYQRDMIFEQPREGLLQQEFVSYEVKDGMLRKIKLTRVFGEPSTKDYIDSWSSTPIVKATQ